MKKALLIPANNYDRSRYKEILLELGLEVLDKAQTADDALKMFRVAKPELIVLDHLVAGYAGIDLLRVIKTDSDTTAVLFLTPVSTKSSIERAFRLKAEDVLVKPFSDGEFASTVLHVLDKQDSRSQLSALT